MRTVRGERVAWRRVNVPHHYVGALSVGDGLFRLSGREPATGIEVSLSIPFEEIEQIRTSASPRENVVGERCVVLELADSEAICLSEVGARPTRPGWLARRLSKLKSPDSRPRRSAPHASLRR